MAVLECHVRLETQFKYVNLRDNGKIFVSHSKFTWVQKPGPRPPALAWLWLSYSPGQAKAHLRPGLAWPSLAQLLASGRSQHITS